MAKPLDLTALIAAVEHSVGVKASATTLINGFADKVKTAVTAALEADENADQASIDAAQAAIDKVTADTLASDDALAAAISSNPA